VIDGLVTNFHQPGTTHLLLVEAFIGRELLDRVYTYALEAGLRFLSYGDGMLLL
jgi:S-adenosylmethionine:tRNA ribosyltransferase-isomerase